MRTFIISVCVFSALLMYAHGYTYFYEKCPEGRKSGDIWYLSPEKCERCQCYDSGGASCSGCGSYAPPPENCTYVTDNTLNYSDCCKKLVCSNN